MTMFQWQDDLALPDCGLFLDSRHPRPLCFVSHGHSDHLGQHQRSICTGVTARLLRHRVGGTGSIHELEFGQPLALEADTSVRLLPAGHILGSSMLLVQNLECRFIYTGDFKLRPSLTVPQAQVEQADTLLMETTYGLPHFRFPPPSLVIEELLERVEAAFAAGRQPIVMGYSLGKSQELVRILTDARHAVTVHGAIAPLNQIYEEAGVRVGPFRRYEADDFHGPAQVDLRERGVLVAPPRVARTAFVTRFHNPCRIILTGWAILKNAIYRYGVDHALPLSDHADFDELLELVERTGARKIFTHHGYTEFAQTLRARGLDARPAQPSLQLTLFGE